MPLKRLGGSSRQSSSTGGEGSGDGTDGMVTAFLDAILHDLRQPVQIVRLLQGVSPGDGGSMGAAARWNFVADMMEDSLASLADFNNLQRSAAALDVSAFPVRSILTGLGRECRDFGRAYRRELRIVDSSAFVRSDPHILARIVRNLTSHMIRHADDSQIVVGCRRRPGKLRVEVWGSHGPAGADVTAHEGPLRDDWSRNAAADVGGPSAGLWAAMRLRTVLADLASIRTFSNGRQMALCVEVPIVAEAA